MKQRELDLLSVLAPSVAKLINGAVDPLNARLKAAENRVVELEAALKEAGIVIDAIGAKILDMPKGPTAEEVAALVKMPTPEEVAALVPPGKDGRDGKDGAPGERGEKGDPGKDGQDGVDGKDGTSGLDGEKGVDGKDGADGKDGIGLADALKDADGCLVLTTTAGSVVKLGRVDGEKGAPGEAGKDGRDGVDGAPGVDGRTEINIADAYEGVWKEGTNKRGTLVTWGGSLWLAKADTESKPEASEEWVLVTKRGRDGKDGRDLSPAPPKPVKL